MPSELATIGPSDDNGRYGKANPLRGANYVDTALTFQQEFPVGSILSPAKFDQWAHSHGLLNVPFGAPKKSDAWQAHLQRRHNLRYNINKAACHPRLDSPFIIEAIGVSIWEVRPPQVAISRNNMTQRIDSLVKTKRRQLVYLMQSADWSLLPPHERMFAESIYDDINGFRRQLELQSEILAEKFGKLEHKLRKAVEAGELRPMNGGIKAILNGLSDDNAADEDDGE